MQADVLIVTYGDDTYVKLLRDCEDHNVTIKDIVLDQLPEFEELERMNAEDFVDDILYNDGEHILEIVGDDPFMKDNLTNFSAHIVQASTDDYTVV